jgi:hypothetical protein
MTLLFRWFALDAPPSLPAAASPNTPSFLLWPDKSAHKMNTQVVID